MDCITDELGTHGVEALRPVPDDAHGSRLSEQDVRRLKREASARHMNWIKAPSTKAILVVNVDKDGRADYIGPNSFAEIAVAFSEGREIFLFHGMPENYEDELKAWGVSCLNGDLSSLIEKFSVPKSSTKNKGRRHSWGPRLFADV